MSEATPSSNPSAAAVTVCRSDALLEGGLGVRLPVRYRSADAVLFFIRYGERAYGYLNRCAHVPMELDWNPGQFFESSGLFLMCATHGAIYEPHTGRCVGGPCRGARLRAVSVTEEERADGRFVIWHPDDDCQPMPPEAAAGIG